MTTNFLRVSGNFVWYRQDMWNKSKRDNTKITPC